MTFSKQARYGTTSIASIPPLWDEHASPKQDAYARPSSLRRVRHRRPPTVAIRASAAPFCHGAEVTEQLDKVAAMLAPKFPAVATMLAEVKEEPDRLRILPDSALGQDLEHEPVRAGQQGGQAQDECGGHLSR
jgi:hypothetical protein